MALTEGVDQSLLIIVALIFAFVIPLAWDGWSGAIIGLVIAAIVTFVRQATGTWLPAHFLPAALETVALVATGLSAGRAGQAVRAGALKRDVDASGGGGVFGSLGMLPADLALIRLEEEVARAAFHGRPLALMLAEIEVVSSDLDDDARDEAYRATARLIETLLREADVPFSLSAHEIGAILPETDIGAASVATGRILEAVALATFTDRQVAQRRRLADVASVHLAVVTLGPEFRTAGELLDGGIQAVRQPNEAVR